jgi:hypothetical protein
LNFYAAGEKRTEYIVGWSHLYLRLQEIGLKVLTPGEMAEMKFPASVGSTPMFSELWSYFVTTRRTFDMPLSIKQLSFMNRLFICKRHANKRPTQRVAPVDVIPLTVPPVIATAPAAPAAAAAAPAATKPKKEKEKKTAVVASSAPTFVVYYKAKPDMRLGAEFKDWSRYLSDVVQSELTDLSDPSITYPSLRAAVLSAMYQKATNKKEWGPKFFGVEGNIHQKQEEIRGKIFEDKTMSFEDKMKAIEKSENKEAATMDANNPTNPDSSFKDRVQWNQAVWDSVKESVYKGYLRQRYDVDEKFQKILAAIRAQQGTILFVKGNEPTDLGVGMSEDGTLLGGGNLIGQWMLEMGR